MKKNGIVNKKGFTLIEVLIYIGGLSVMLLGITSFMGIFMDARVKSQVIAEVEQQGSNILHQVSQMIRDSQEVTFPLPSNASQELALNFPGVVSIGLNQQIMQVNIDEIYSLNSPRVEVSDLSFQNLSASEDSDLIRISFTLSHANPSDIYQYHYSKRFYATASPRPSE